MAKKAPVYSRAYAELYKGGNETIDRLHDGSSEVWIVNGVKGRRILLLDHGTTKAEAKAVYDERFGMSYYSEKDVA